MIKNRAKVHPLPNISTTINGNGSQRKNKSLRIRGQNANRHTESESMKNAFKSFWTREIRKTEAAKQRLIESGVLILKIC